MPWHSPVQLNALIGRSSPLDSRRTNGRRSPAWPTPCNGWWNETTNVGSTRSTKRLSARLSGSLSGFGARVVLAGQRRPVVPEVAVQVDPVRVLPVVSRATPSGLIVGITHRSTPVTGVPSRSASTTCDPGLLVAVHRAEDHRRPRVRVAEVVRADRPVLHAGPDPAYADDGRRPPVRRRTAVTGPVPVGGRGRGHRADRTDAQGERQRQGHGEAQHEAGAGARGRPAWSRHAGHRRHPHGPGRVAATP